jgi:Fe-S-cluster formation regulator IscX/YfhJ
MEPQRFKAPYITQEAAWTAADQIRALHWSSGELPVEVEEILWKVGLRLDLISALKKDSDVDALLTSDLKRIIVDLEEYKDDRMQNRMRFSIAHELGHFVLHRALYEKIEFTSLEDWIEFVQAAPEEEYSFMELHANEFSGRLLVPPDRLKQEFLRAVKKAKQAGFKDWDKSGDAARGYIASSICRIFGVSSDVIEKRIIRERLRLPPA